MVIVDMSSVLMWKYVNLQGHQDALALLLVQGLLLDPRIQFKWCNLG